MNGRSTIKSPVGCRCHYILKRCMAVHLRKQSLVRCVPQQTEPSPYWMYDNGYLIFQSFLESNLKCVWNRSLVEAMQVVKYEGYVSPGVLLLTSDPCSMEVIRGAWCRNVLRPPNSYVVTKIGDIEDCVVEDLNQGQFTPLSEALCLVILELTSANQNATIDTVRSALKILFSNIQPPAEHVVYDAIVNLMSENKIYQTSRGYFVVTPEVQRLVGSATASPVHGLRLRGGGKKAFLMSTEEAYVKVHGDIETVRDGDQTHQNIQTNLADIISGGNPDDKKLSPRSRGEMAAGKLERRNSLRSGSATRRLQATLQRSGSMRHISNKNKTDECANNNNCANNGSAEQRKSPGIFSRLFGSRRSSSKSRKSNGYAAAAASTQFPWPPHDDWFNKSVQPQQTTSTQTEKDDEDERFGEAKRLAAARATRSATLPRKSRTVVMAAAAAPSSLAGSSSSGRPDNGSNSNKAATGVTGQTTTTTTPAKKAYPSSGSSGYNSLPRMNGGGRKTGKNSPSSETSYNNNNKAPAAVSKTTADEDASCGGPDTPTTGRGSNFDSTYSCDEISVNNCASFAVQAVDKTAAAAAANKTAADLRREYFRGPNKYEKGKQQQQQRYFNRDKTTAAVVLGPALLHHKYFENACKIK